MNFLRNKFVVIGMAVVAVVMLIRSLSPMWRRGPRGSTTAQTQANVAPAPAPVATNAPPPPASRQKTAGAQPERGIDFAQVGWEFDGAPRRDPFQVIGPGATNLARLYPSATELLTLRAVWWQSGTILADVNNRIVREETKIKASKGELSAEFKILNIGVERIWVDGPNGEEEVLFDPTLSLRGVDVKLQEGTNDTFAVAKRRVDWPYRFVNGMTNDAYADAGWFTFTGKVLQKLDEGKFLVKDANQDPPVILKNVPLDLVDDQSLAPVRCKDAGTESYTAVNNAKRTVRVYDFGLPCSPPKEVIASLKLQKDALLQQRSKANERRVKIEIQQAEKGDATAQYMLGRRFLYGDGVPKNEDEARNWLQAAALQGNPDARVKLQSLAAQK